MTRFAKNGAALQSQITTRRAEFLFSLSATLNAGTLLAGTLITAMYWSRLDHQILVLWLVGNLAVVGFRLRLQKSFNARNRYGDATRWLNAYFISSAILGSLWGGFFTYVGFTLDVEALFFFLLPLGAMLSGSCIAFSNYLKNYFFFTVPATIPASVTLIMTGGSKAYIGIIAIGWFVFLLSIALRFNKYLSSTIRHEFENIQLQNEMKLTIEQNSMLEEELAIKNQILDHLASQSGKKNNPQRIRSLRMAKS